MKKHGAIAVIIVGVGMALSGARAFAEKLSVELLFDPKNPVIDLAAPQEVAIVARTIGNDAVTYRWKLEGVGKLGGGEGDAGRLYIPPQTIKGDVMQTTVSVTVTDRDGNNARASVTFTLQRTPTPTPREEPSDGDYSVDDLKAKAKWNAWLNKQMRPAFEEAAALEQADLDAADKREAWSRFLQNFAQNHPFSEEDDRMRQQAKERIAHWKNYATPTPEPTATPRSCWENAAPGATCKEDTTGMEFVYVPGGCFQMGSNNGDSDEKPVHEVCLQGFWMGKYEVTNAQYRRFKKDHDSQSYEGKSLNGDDQPVVMVSWNDAQAFLKQLNAAASVETHGRASLQFRLPTEAEWEYAARGGTEKIRYWGDDPKHTQACAYANVADQSAKKLWTNWTVHECDDDYAVTAPVGRFQPNAFGLYDMLGNVWEWCQDTYHENYNGAPNDGSAWGSLGDEKANRLLRGGSWYDSPSNCRSANRSRNDPDGRYNNIGARVVVGAR